IAFWMVSGFRELPSDLRTRALQAANSIKGDSFGGVESNFIGAPKLVTSVAKKISAELETLPAHYGKRKVDRICFMGRLSNLVINESDAFGDYVRFPEHMDAIVRQLDLPWTKDMSVFFKRFDAWSCDTRFVLAGVEPLKPFNKYEWYLRDI
ncbi:MAG: hypothetical protein JKY60_17460, partial [Kordiimonadaceae bacterium]|nr:hypothetical protein [Kordiimonadaceae bacterium]